MEGGERISHAVGHQTPLPPPGARVVLGIPQLHPVVFQVGSLVSRGLYRSHQHQLLFDRRPVDRPEVADRRTADAHAPPPPFGFRAHDALRAGSGSSPPLRPYGEADFQALFQFGLHEALMFLVVLITVFGPLSGGHFNPAVTLVFALRREIGARLGLAYAAVQMLGAVAGVAVAHAMFEAPLLQVSSRLRTGPTQVFSEGVATFGLVLTILGCVRLRPAFTPAAVGLYITSAYWFTASTSFANPAVTAARSLSDTFTGIAPASAPGFVAGQLAGALAAALFVGWLLPGRRP